MKFKLLALTGLMAATMGLTACDSHKEDAVEDIQDAKEEIVDAKQELNEAQEEGKVVTEAKDAVVDAETAATEAAAKIETSETPVVETTPDVIIVDEATQLEAIDAADGTVTAE